MTGDTEINARQSQPVLLTTTSTRVEFTALTSCSNPMRYLAKHWIGTRSWPSTLYSCLLNSFIVYQKDGGQKPFLGFQREVIEALIFETGADMEIPREEHVIRLTERHFVSPVPETASKQKPQKRCRVCYKKKVRKDSRYHFPNCPSNPGLWYYPCFELYHTKVN